ncbi:MAG TPA: hypothetical protein VK588_01630 [Chitinophagaceae bacterium]|nr:hypothetical protein [Chitinophagaceae bacterium]
MRRFITTIIFVFILIQASKGQSYEGTVDYQKKDEKAIIIEFPYPASVVEDAIVDKLEKMGYKKKDSKGFLVYKNIVLTEISTEPADYIIRVDKKSRKEKDESIVYLFMSRNDQNIISTSDEIVNSNTKSFLNRLSPEVEAYNLEVQIKDQDAIVTKAEKKLKDLRDDKDNMQKKIQKLQDDLEKNGKDQDSQQKEIDRQRQILEAMRGKRKVT